MAKSVTFRLDDDKLQFLDQLAKSQDRDRSYLINQAVEDYLDVRRWQIEQINKAVADADAGKFASPEEVEAFFRMNREQL
jgi:RHH-type transcriptional regulator, rel operon repressor / antitoxin RelB